MPIKLIGLVISSPKNSIEIINIQKTSKMWILLIPLDFLKLKESTNHCTSNSIGYLIILT